MENGKQEDQDIAMVKKHAEELCEHFDSVQIFATRYEPATLDGTVTVNIGVGNWYARYGQVSEWLVRQNERTRKHARDEYDE